MARQGEMAHTRGMETLIGDIMDLGYGSLSPSMWVAFVVLAALVLTGVAARLAGWVEETQAKKRSK